MGVAGRVGVKWGLAGSGLMMMTFWSGMKSSAESRRVNGSSAAVSASSSVKNSKVLDLKAMANFWNISESCGGFDGVISISSISVSFSHNRTMMAFLERETGFGIWGSLEELEGRYVCLLGCFGMR